jgi:molybdate transport system permease protein
MDTAALRVSLTLAVATVVVLLPLGIWLGHLLAVRTFRGKPVAEALVAIPLILPPTVLGYYLLTIFGARSPLGQIVADVFGQPLAFSFAGLVVASVIVNIPFVVQPIQRAFQAVPDNLRDAAACCGLTPWQRFRRIELPLAWPGVVTAAILVFAHTLGEFGVVLMIGGNIPGETRVASVQIYDYVQALEYGQAHRLAAVLLVFSFLVLLGLYTWRQRPQRVL